VARSKSGVVMSHGQVLIGMLKKKPK